MKEESNSLLWRDLLTIMKLLALRCLMELYLYTTTGTIMKGLGWGILLISHLLVQFVCSRKTRFGTKEFIFWQAVSFAAIIAARGYGLLPEIPRSMPYGEVFQIILSQLPYFLAFHGVVHLIYIAIIAVLARKKGQKQPQKT